jgi:hypothetical protein
MVDMSTFTMSPSAKTSSSLGNPWHTTSLMAVQTL